MLFKRQQYALSCLEEITMPQNKNEYYGTERFPLYPSSPPPPSNKAEHFLSFITAVFSKDDFLPKGKERLTNYIQLLNQ